MPLEENGVTLSFWTDRPQENESYNMIFANEVHVGNFIDSLSNPICGQKQLVDFDIYDSTDLHLTIRNEEGNAKEIGTINLYSISTGIKIKPSEQGEINVEQSLDDICTLVFIDWKN